MSLQVAVRHTVMLLAFLAGMLPLAAQCDSASSRKLSDRAWENRFADPRGAVLLADSALRCARDCHQPLLIAKAFRAKALAMVIDEQIVEGMPFYDSALTYAHLAGNHDYEASCYSLMAGMYGDHGDYDKAIELYTKGLEAAEQSGHAETIAMLSNNLAESYVAGRRSDSLALKQYERALENSTAQQDWPFAAMVAANISQVHAARHDLEHAAPMLLSAAELMYRDTSDQYRYATTLHVLADAYSQLDSNARAIELAQHSLRIMDALHRPDNALRPLSVLARASVQQRNIPAASFYADRLVKEAQQQHAKMFIRDGYKALSDIARLCNDPAEALRYYELYKSWNDSVFTADRERSISNMELRSQLAQQELELVLETQKKDAENNALKERNASLIRERFLAVISCIVFLALGVLLYFSNRKKQKINAELQEEKKTVEKQAHEKSLLVHEIHHRVKNNLTLLKSLLFLQSKASTHEEVKRILEECQARVQSMALVHGNLYGGTATGMLNVSAFTETLFSDLAASFRAHDHDIAFDISGSCREVNIAQSVALGLILNELTTNSLKYAFAETEYPEISVAISETAEHIIIAYADNGPGLPQGFEPETGGFGFRLIRILSQQLNATIVYEATEKRSVFRIAVPAVNG